MTLPRPIAVAVGALTIWPFVYMCFFVGFLFLSFFAVSHGGSGGFPEGSDGPPVWFITLMVAHVSTMLIALASTAFYIVYLFKTDRVVESRKALWAVALFMGGPIAQAIFFYVYVWPTRWPVPQPPSLSAIPTPD